MVEEAPFTIKSYLQMNRTKIIYIYIDPITKISKTNQIMLK